jgi:glycosyltransferase involved in cell wall biosynthesis
MTAPTVWFVIPGDFETKTGGYGYDRYVIAGLRARGWTVHVISLPGAYPFPDASARGTADRELAAIPDHACVVVDGLACGALPVEAARHQRRLCIVALVHHPLALETGLDAATADTLRASERDALAAACGVVVTSMRTVGAVEALGVDAGRIAVVEPGTAVAASATGSTDGPIRLLCVASIVPRKGHDTLLDALARLAHLDWRLICVGGVDRDTAFAGRVMSQREASAVGDRVAFVGELEGEALDAAYHGADIFVLPTYYEGYGMAVAEAVARGIPVVSSPTGAIAELIGRDAGILVPAGDAGLLAATLERLMADRTLLEQLRQGALRARASLPTWEVQSARIEEALRRFTTR